MDELHLNNIPIYVVFQCRKIGNLLIGHVSVYLQKQDIKRIYLEVSGEKKLAQRLYKSVGFQHN